MTDKAGGVQVAFLRGINVGGKNKLPMADLRGAFEACGGSNVRSYIQSGNVVFRSPAEASQSVANAVSEWITANHGFSVSLICRSLAQLKAVVRSNPFLARGEDPSKLHVGFLAGEPGAWAIASLDSNRSPPDEFEVVGSHVYLLLPQGVARSKLTNAYFDSKLNTTTTIRNWRTIGKLLEMAEAA